MATSCYICTFLLNILTSLQSVSVSNLSSCLGQFDVCLFHPNIYPSGTVCLSILNEDEDWKPSITVGEILKGIQNLLENPNPESPAQTEPYYMYVDDLPSYMKRVKEQVKKISVHL